MLPGHVHCFVDLEDYQTGQRQEFGGIWLEASTYAVVETSQYEEIDEEKRNPELFLPLRLDIVALNGGEVERQFWLANVEAFQDVACVVPDIGGPPNRCFFLQPRNDWAEIFVKWLKAPHNQDVMSDEEFTESEEEDESSDEEDGK